MMAGNSAGCEISDELLHFSGPLFAHLKNGKNYIQSPSCLRGLNEIMIGNNNGTFYMPESVLDAFIFKLCK